MAKRKAKLKITPVFCKNGDPYATVEWTTMDVEKTTRGDKEVLFSQNEVEVPAHWTEKAAFTTASKYFRGAKDDPNREKSVKTLFNRVTETITKKGVEYGYFNEKNGAIFERELKWLLIHQYFAFNSPVFFNVGAEKRPQGSACFILGIEDNLRSILNLQVAEAVLFSQGSGSGANLSRLRGCGEPLSKGGIASGPLSFVKGYNAWAGIIRSGGVQRRAAKFVRLDDTHPDVYNGLNNGTDFITFKSHEEKKAWALLDAGYGSLESGELRSEAYETVSGQNCNFSVGISDAFMRGVMQDQLWVTTSVLTGKTAHKFKAEDMLQAIAEGAWLCGDPGIQFDDRVNEWHTCPRGGRIRSSNPCGEFIFIDDSACNLGSVNLVAFMTMPEGIFHEEEFKAAIRLATIAQDILVTMCGYPSEEIAKNSNAYRPLGVGFANLGGLVMAMGLPYDSPEARLWASGISTLMTATAYKTSIELAKAVGSFNQFEKNRRPMIQVIRKHKAAADNILVMRQDSELVSLVESAQATWSEVITEGSKIGFRNAQVTLIAPTGTIAHMMGCATQGIEPDMAIIWTKPLDGGGSMVFMNPIVPTALETLGYSEEERVKILKEIAEVHAPEKTSIKEQHLPVFDSAYSPMGGSRCISISGHLQMMAAVQPHVSGAISKTIALPKSTEPGEIKELIISAWKLGLKSLTVYRSGSKRLQPVVTDDSECAALTTKPLRQRLPDTRDGKIHKFIIGGQEGYLIPGFYPDGKLGEIFVTLAMEGSTLRGLMDCFATSISIGLQHNVPLSTYVNKFVGSKFEPNGYTGNSEIPRSSSIPDYMFRYLARYDDDSVKLLPPPRSTEAIDLSKEDIGPPELEVPDETTLTMETVGTDELRPEYELCRTCGNLAQKKGTCFECDHCGQSGSCS